MPATSPHVRDVTADSFQADVVDASQQVPVVLDFWSPACGPCVAMGPVLERLIDERQGAVRLAKINVDNEQELAEYFQISAIPAIKVIRNGQIAQQFEGALPESALRQFLDEISPAADPALEQARAAEADSPAAAEALYRQKVAEQPANDDARLGLARTLLALGRPDEVAEVLEPVSAEGEAGLEADRLKAQVYFARAAAAVPDEEALRQRVAAGPGDAQARLDLGVALARRGQYADALAMLLAAAEADPRLAGGKVREVMVQVFYALGSNHPLANEYRSRLSRLLY
jgi:putative thioredoxin